MTTSHSMRTLARAVFAPILLTACGSPPAAVCPVVPAPGAGPAPVAVATASSDAVSSTLPAAPPAPPAPDVIIVSVTNPASFARTKESITLTKAELEKLAPSLELKKTLVFDAAGAPVLSQLVAASAGADPSELVFQADFIAGETKSFRLRAGERKLPPTSAYQVYGRFVRERHDDFAWENDLVAHRMYGPELETTKKEPLVSSGIDVWAKRVPRLLVNEWYMTDDYHQDHGDGADFYSVGKTRGCGGDGFWIKDRLSVSRNFTTSRVLANGPIRLIFELDYAPWDAGGGKVSETKRVTLDAGSFFNRFESSFSGKKALPVALGIAKHPGAAEAFDGATASMRVWEPADHEQGNYGCAVVLPPGSAATEKQTDDNYLLVTTSKPGEPLRYYVGSTWDRAGHVTSAEAWAETVQKFDARLASPLKVALAAGPGATPPAAAPASPAPAAPAPSSAPAPSAAPAPSHAPPAPTATHPGPTVAAPAAQR
jgi:hypothetical protein